MHRVTFSHRNTTNLRLPVLRRSSLGPIISSNILIFGSRFCIFVINCGKSKSKRCHSTANLLPHYLVKFKCLTTGWAKKPDLFSVDNSATVSGIERRGIQQKFQNAVKNKKTHLHSKAFKYFLPNLHKYSSLPNFCQI